MQNLQKFFTFVSAASDPTCVVSRKLDMLLDAHPRHDAYTPRKMPLQPMLQASSGMRKGYAGLANKVSEVAKGQETGAGPDFASLMLAVRDQGDRAAYGVVFQHFAPRVKAFLMKSGSDAALAEELAQDVMVTVWHKSAQFDPARASLSTWIFTIARNRRIDYFRRTRRPEPEDLDWGAGEEPDAADIYQSAEETRRLGAALSTLPEPQRALIERAYYGDLSHSEIAAQTGLPLGTIKSRIRLALERLRQNMN
jgi:RNA polymerase sigma factor (sigma-70 family)